MDSDLSAVVIGMSIFFFPFPLEGERVEVSQGLFNSELAREPQLWSLQRPLRLRVQLQDGRVAASVQVGDSFQYQPWLSPS